MRSKKKRNKAYRPRAAYQIGGLGLIASINRAKPLDVEETIEICVAYDQSIKAITGGRADPYHFDTIIYAVNVGTILAEEKPDLGGEYIDLLLAALDGMHRAMSRYEMTKKIGLDGEALKALRDVEELLYEQLKVATQAELAWAIDEMYRRIKEQKAA